VNEIDTVFFTDDGSSDDSVQKVENLAQKFKKLRILRDNWGNIGYANRVSRYSAVLNDYDYALILDSDDRLIPSGITLGLRRLQKEKLDTLFGATALINQAGEPTGIIDGVNTPQMPFPPDLYSCCLDNGTSKSCNANFNSLLHQNWVRTTSIILFRTSCIEDLFPIPRVRANPDWFIALKLASRGNSFYTAIPFAEHRIHSSNLTSDNLEDSKVEAGIVFKAILGQVDISNSPHARLAIESNLYLS
jgi:glycosyltransferase involved in cell wall biosynthesis